MYLIKNTCTYAQSKKNLKNSRDNIFSDPVCFFSVAPLHLYMSSLRVFVLVVNISPLKFSILYLYKKRLHKDFNLAVWTWINHNIQQWKWLALETWPCGQCFNIWWNNALGDPSLNLSCLPLTGLSNHGKMLKNINEKYSTQSVQCPVYHSSLDCNIMMVYLTCFC